MAPPPQQGDMILVTGATGRTGRHIVKYLLDLGFKVRVMSRSATRAREMLAADGIAADVVEITEGDVADRAAVAQALKPSAKGAKVSRLIFAAGGDKAVYRDVNGLAPQLFAEEGAQQDLAQLILVSAAWVTRPWSATSLIINTAFADVPMGWHLRGEDALRRSSGIDFVIVRAGRIVDDGPKAALGVKIGQGDRFSFMEGGQPGMCPVTLAETCVQSLLLGSGMRATIEVIGDSKATDCRTPQFDWKELFSKLEPERTWVERAEDPCVTHKRAAASFKRGCAICAVATVGVITALVVLAVTLSSTKAP